MKPTFFETPARSQTGRVKSRQRDSAEAASFNRVAWRLHVARRYEKGACNTATSVIDRPLRNQRAAEAVGGQDGRRGAGANGFVECCDPLVAFRMIKVLLLHASKRGVLTLPVRLPMLRAGVPEARYRQDNLIHHPCQRVYFTPMGEAPATTSSGGLQVEQRLAQHRQHCDARVQTDHAKQIGHDG